MRVRTPRRPLFVAMTSSLAILSAGLLTGCPARSDLEVRWTIDGQEAADACDGLGDTISVNVFNADDPNATPTEETFTATCGDGSAVVQAGNNASVTVSLLRGETEVGTSRPQDVELTTTVDGERPVLSTNVEISTGRLEAVLEVGGASCGDAGATSFELTLRRRLGSVDSVDVDTATVACTGGEARYVNENVRVGTRHFVFATTSANGINYTTDGDGVGVDLSRARTVVTVNLRDEERPPVLDAGGNDIGNPPPFDGGQTGPVDAGPATDAGVEQDAGTPVDSGPADAGVVVDSGTDAGDPGIITDAGTDAGAESDAGETDAGQTDAGSDAGAADAG